MTIDISALNSLTQTWHSFLAWIQKAPQPGPLSIQERVKAIIRVIFIVIREFRSDDIPLRASALTFTIILSLVPLLALGTAVLKGIGAGDEFRQTAHRFIDQLDKPEYEVTIVNPEDQTLPNQETPQQLKGSKSLDISAPPSLSFHLRQAIDRIFDYVDRTNFATIGTFGIIGLLISVLVVLGSIEMAMNAVWQVDNNRSFSRKILDYLALMILLPLTLNLALAAEAAIRSPALQNRLTDILHITWLGHQFLKIFPIVLVISSLTILYRFLPNTRVNLWPALAGGLFAGGSWFMAQTAYLRLQIGVARYNAIYGSFATLPLFLLWLYLGWLIFLTGAEMAFAIQRWRIYLWQNPLPSALARLALAFNIMGLIKEDFTAGTITTLETLANRLQISEVPINSIITSLIEANLLRRHLDPIPGFIPANAHAVLDHGEIIDAILGKVEGDATGSLLAARAITAAKKELMG
ncbi:MAG: YihY/virulence factor BrkB family protein [Proteobacteria bacterium]|nr:YihY/virulence factor BrkB family protein [Pseudomonadota bacterium]MBU1685883.1 YihY/virulence factor BrkB family protein [Pseudomonadota bacterium]